METEWGNSIEVDAGIDGHICLELRARYEGSVCAFMNPSEARTLAAILMAAADEQESLDDGSR